MQRLAIFVALLCSLEFIYVFLLLGDPKLNTVLLI